MPLLCFLSRNSKSETNDGVFGCWLHCARKKKQEIFSNFKIQISNFEFQVSSFNFQVSSFEFRISKHDDEVNVFCYQCTAVPNTPREYLVLVSLEVASRQSRIVRVGKLKTLAPHSNQFLICLV